MSTATLTPAPQIPADPHQPDPSPVQDHVRQLRESGGTYRSIAAAAGLAESEITRTLDSARKTREAPPRQPDHDAEASR